MTGGARRDAEGHVLAKLDLVGVQLQHALEQGVRLGRASPARLEVSERRQERLVVRGELERLLEGRPRSFELTTGREHLRELAPQPEAEGGHVDRVLVEVDREVGPAGGAVEARQLDPDVSAAGVDLDELREVLSGGASVAAPARLSRQPTRERQRDRRRFLALDLPLRLLEQAPESGPGQRPESLPLVQLDAQELGVEVVDVVAERLTRLVHVPERSVVAGERDAGPGRCRARGPGPAPAPRDGRCPRG